MKKVLVFGMTDNPGGVESFIMAYYRRIDRTRLQFDFLCNNKSVAYEDEIETLGGNIYKICARSENFARYRSELNDFFRNNADKYCAVWVNVCSLANIDYLKAAKKYGIPVRIIHSHNTRNMDGALRGILHKINRLFILNYATHFFACTDEAAHWFFSGRIMHSDRFKKIVNAVDTENFAFDGHLRQETRRELLIDDGALVLGNIGRLHSQKNQSFLLDIFASVLRNRADAILLLVGGGEDEQMLRQKSARLGIIKNVKFLGVRADVHALLCAMDVFVFPSLYEGLGIALIEAQSTGLFCFTSDGVVPKDAAVTENIEYLPLGDAELWSKKILLKRNFAREDASAQVIRAGYDISQRVHEIQDFFEKECH